MEHGKYPNTSVHVNETGEEINLLDYLLVLARNKRMILVTCITAFLLSCGVSLLLPNIFTATARILPPPGPTSNISSLLGNVGDLAALAGISTGGSSGDLYVGMLQSRTVSDAIIDRFDLMKVYDEDYREKAYQALADHVTVSLGKEDGIIAISVDDEDPRRAAAIANRYVKEIMDLNVRLNLSSSGRERVFLGNRLALVKGDLANAEDAMKDFQEKNKAIRIDDQAAAIIDAISQLKAQLASKEVELGVHLSYQTEKNYEVKALREGIAQIRGQIRKLEQTPTGKKYSDDIFVPTSEVPELGVQYARLLRNFKIQETLFEMLTKQYEAAKISEARDTSTLQVLDEAVAPDRKSRPKRGLIVLLATAAAGFLAVLAAFLREYFARIPEQDQERIRELKNHLRLGRPKLFSSFRK